MNIWSRLVVGCAALMLVVAGCGSSGSSSGSSEARAPEISAPIHEPRTAWSAPNPGGTPQGGKYASYEALAAAGQLIVGVTFAEPEGSMLVRLDPKTGKPVWKALLPTYAERDALGVEDGRIILVAPGGKVLPEGDEGEGPALVYGFTAEGAKAWEHSIGIPISGTYQSSWIPPVIPEEVDGEEALPLVTDMTAIPGETVMYEGSELRGVNDRTGKEWTYTPYPSPEMIFGPDPVGPADLHLVSGGNQEVLIDGHTGKEVKRETGRAKGRPLGLLGPLFDQSSADLETPARVPGIGALRPVAIESGNDVVFGTDEHRLVAIDSTTGKKLWELPTDLKDAIEGPAAAGAGYMVFDGGEGTMLLR